MGEEVRVDELNLVGFYFSWSLAEFLAQVFLAGSLGDIFNMGERYVHAR